MERKSEMSAPTKRNIQLTDRRKRGRAKTPMALPMLSTSTLVLLLSFSSPQLSAAESVRGRRQSSRTRTTARAGQQEHRHPRKQEHEQQEHRHRREQQEGRALHTIADECYAESSDVPLTGYFAKPHRGCLQYVFCSNGNLLGTMKCPPGLLFDPSITGCGYASGVQCPTDDSEAGMVPQDPMDAWADGDGGGDVTTTAWSAPTPRPTPRPTVRRTPRPTPRPVAPPVPCQDSAGSPVTGYKVVPGLGCRQYMYCSSGTKVGGDLPCPTDLLFDESMANCNFADQVSCPTDDTGPGSSVTLPSWELPDTATGAGTGTVTGPQQNNPVGGGTNSRGGNSGNGISGSVPATRKTVIGYYASWQWYDREKLHSPKNVDFDKITRINYAFFQPTTGGDLFGTDAWGDPQVLFGPYDWSGGGAERCSWDGPGLKNCAVHKENEGLMKLAKNKGVEVYASIGGWTLSNNFSSMSRNSASRNNFAKQCVELMEAYGFDGIDLDWEYPGHSDHGGSPDDKQNWKNLLTTLRNEIDNLGARKGRKYGLTAALPCGPKHMAYQDAAHLSNKLDDLNLMTYDFHGAWDASTGVNSPLYNQGFGEPGFSLEGCVDMWTAAGADPDKINVGLAFYGRSANGATGLNQGISGGVDDTTWYEDEGSPQYYNIVKEWSNITPQWDDNSATPYASVNGRSFLSYDDPRSICLKVEYAQDRGLKGYIIWELSGDVLPDLSTPLLDAIDAKVKNPNEDCDSMKLSPMSMSAQTSLLDPAASWNSDPQIIGGGLMSTNGNVVYPDSTVMGPTRDGDGTQTIGGALQENSEPSVPKQPWTSCPEGFNGLWGTRDCNMYFYCSDGQIEGGKLACVPGTKFDSVAGVCNWDELVNCEWA